MLKNDVVCKERFEGTRYLSCTALARRGTDYFVVMARLSLMDTVEGVKLIGAQFLDKKHLAVKEASMIIKRTEYLLVYQVADKDCFGEALLVEKPCVEMERHDKGTLYTQFKRDNNHYKEETYFMK